MSAIIKKIDALEILDSRGYPTIECSVVLSDNSIGTASIASGASVGEHEAMEMRDNDHNRFKGKGVLLAINNIITKIQPELINKDPFDQENIDAIMLNLDQSKQKSILGANSILAVSMAVAKAAANSAQVPFYQYLGGNNAIILPMPMMNVLNGGAHADNSVDIQEIMIIPYKAQTFSEAVHICFNVYQALKQLLLKSNKVTAVGDEGGFAPDFDSNYDAMQMVLQAIEKAGYIAGKDVVMSLDIAASELYQANKYHLKSENKSYNAEKWIDEISNWLNNFPIVSIEDAMDQNDFLGWQMLTKKLGNKIQLVGDDVFVTNAALLKHANQNKIANAILIKPNQVGSLTETLTAIGYAKKYNYSSILSHRSGETEDTSIADIAVATGAGQIKSGAPCRTDRLAKYNQLLRIEKQLKNRAIFMAGQSLYK